MSVKVIISPPKIYMRNDMAKKIEAKMTGDVKLHSYTNETIEDENKKLNAYAFYQDDQLITETIFKKISSDGKSFQKQITEFTASKDKDVQKCFTKDHTKEWKDFDITLENDRNIKVSLKNSVEVSDDEVRKYNNLGADAKIQQHHVNYCKYFWATIAAGVLTHNFKKVLKSLTEARLEGSQPVPNTDYYADIANKGSGIGGDDDFVKIRMSFNSFVTDKDEIKKLFKKYFGKAKSLLVKFEYRKP